MGSFIGVFIFIAAVCFLGFLVQAVIASLCKNTDRAKVGLRHLSLFFALGAGSYTFWELFFSFSGLKSQITHFLALCFVLLLINFTFHLKRLKTLFLPRFGLGRVKPLVALSWGIILLLCLASLLMAMAFPQFDIDLLGHILIKAKVLTSDTYKTSVFFHHPLFANLHSRYPPFGAIFYNLLFLFRGKTLACYQIVNYFIFFLLGLSIYLYLKDRIPTWQNMAWLFIFFSTRAYISSQFIMDSTDITLSLYFLLAVFFIPTLQNRNIEITDRGLEASVGTASDASVGTASDASVGTGSDASVGTGSDASVGTGWHSAPKGGLNRGSGFDAPRGSILELRKDKDSYNLTMLMMLLGFSTLVKNEALVFSVIAMVMAFWLGKKMALRYIWIWLLIALPWLFYRYSLPDVILSPELLIKGINAIPSLCDISVALQLVFGVLINQWNAAFMLLFPALAILAMTRDYKKVAAVFFSVIVSLIFIYALVIWLHIGRADSFERNGFFRILSHVYPMAIICLALASAKLLPQKKRIASNLLNVVK
jgi:hypothetical protein